MSEKKPFDAAIKILFGHTDYGAGTIGEVKGRSCEAAIRVLEEWPKWEPLIEAAGKVDKGALLTLGANAVCIADYYCQGDELKELEARFKRGEADLKIIIEALPEKEEK